MREQSHLDADAKAVMEFSGQVLGELQSGKLVLPMLPEVTLRVSDLTSDPNASLQDLATLIVTDATLASQLIKVSNSPLYRGREPIETVPIAVSRLGFRAVRNLVSSLAMQQMFTATSPRVEQHLRNMWELNVDVSARSQLLAASVPGVAVDEAMLAGLIHNIGILPLLVKADENPELIEDEAALDALIADVSAQIGVAVLESWDFPASLVAVVEHYREFDRQAANDPDLIDVVQVASLQSHLTDLSRLNVHSLNEVRAFQRLGVQTEVEVDEFDENSEEYAAALRMFG